MILFFDTETTDLPRQTLPLNHAGQPHLVQVAAILADFDGTEHGVMNFTITPDGYSIPDVSARIHGITTELAQRVGVPVRLAIAAFNNMAIRATELVAHNISFDLQLYQIALARLGVPSRVETLKRICTMEQTRNLCKLPPTEKMKRAGIMQYKSPKLEEAYKILLGKPLVNAHNALADVQACKELYMFLRGMAQDGTEQPEMVNA